MTIKRTLDRLEWFDERSREYPAVEIIDSDSIVSNTWTCDVYLDQGREGACVGFSWTHELSAAPEVVVKDADFALQIYKRAQQIDPWPGEDYSGTSVLAGVKAIQELGYISEYRWAFGTEDVLKTISHLGPVVLGVPWHSSFYTPDPEGKIWLNDDIVGGHAILAVGVDVVKIDPEGPDTYDNIDRLKTFVRLHNSWGTEYGDGGDCYISVYDLDYLLSQGGEACIPTVRSVV